MQDFLQSTPFVLSFMGLTLVIQMFAGNKVTEKFLLLVLLGMVVSNSKKVSDLITRGFSSNG
jgi:hypothetical protein